MKSKIEKLISVDLIVGNVYTNKDHVAMANKINEIIDHLNTQPQAEGYPQKAVYISAEEAERREKGVKSTPEEQNRIYQATRMHNWEVCTCEYCEKYRSKLKEIKSTPEQKEEWEEGLRELIEMYRGIKSSEWETLKRNVVYQVKQLLSEREMFTKDELFMLKLATNDIHNKGNGAYDEIGEKIEKMLSNLSSKSNGRQED